MRNSQGLALASATWRVHGSDDVIVAEALALLYTIRLTLECGFRRMIFEADNQRLIRLVQNEKEEDRTYLGQIIGVIRQLQSHFDTRQFRHISRTCNKVAHCMAQLAHLNPDKVWIEEVPIEAQEMYFHEILN